MGLGEERVPDFTLPGHQKFQAFPAAGQDKRLSSINHQSHLQAEYDFTESRTDT